MGYLAATVMFGLVTMPAAAAPVANCSTAMWLTASVTEGPAPLLVSFSLQVNWTNSPTLNWSFGDGTYLSGVGSPYLRPTHPYDLQGTYLATVHVTNGVASGSCDVFVIADVPEVVVVAHAAPEGPSAPTTFTFVGTASGGNLPYLVQNWWFSDGTSAPGWQATHTFAFPGTYTATFTVTDSQGNLGVAVAWVNVSAPARSGLSQGPSNVDPVSVIAGVAGVAAGAGLLYVWSAPGGSTAYSGGRRGGRTGSTALVPVYGPDSLSYLRGPRGAYGRFLEEVPADPDQPVRGLPALSISELALLGPDAPEPFALPEPAAPASGQAPEAFAKRAEADSLRVSQRILIHLYAQGRIDESETATVGFTQRGMVDALSASQSLLSNVLRRMIYSGYLTQDLRHVRGMDRRLRVYRLTPKGERVAHELFDKSKVRRAS